MFLKNELQSFIVILDSGFDKNFYESEYRLKGQLSCDPGVLEFERAHITRESVKTRQVQTKWLCLLQSDIWSQVTVHAFSVIASMSETFSINLRSYTFCCCSGFIFGCW